MEENRPTCNFSRKCKLHFICILLCVVNFPRSDLLVVIKTHIKKNVGQCIEKGGGDLAVNRMTVTEECLMFNVYVPTPFLNYVHFVQD